jgi:hypothetical protein
MQISHNIRSVKVEDIRMCIENLKMGVEGKGARESNGWG